MITYKRLENAVITGFNALKSGKPRQWNVKATGKTSKYNNKLLLEVFDPSVNTKSKLRLLNVTTFTGTIKMTYKINGTDVVHTQKWVQGRKVSDRQKAKLGKTTLNLIPVYNLV